MVGNLTQITDGVAGSKVRPAAYKTGTTSDNKDVHAYGYLAMPSKKTLPALVAGVWMGNSDSTPNDGKLSLDTSAPSNRYPNGPAAVQLVRRLRQELGPGRRRRGSPGALAACPGCPAPRSAR